MQLTLSHGDLAVIVFYVLCIVAIALWHIRGKSDTGEFLLAGRKLTLPIFVGTLVSTWYGGIFGIAEFTAMAGLGTWLVQGIVWYIAYLAFALFLAKRIRKMSFYTVADVLADRFDGKVAFLGGIFTYLMVNPAPYILSLGVALHAFLGISLINAIALSALFTILYTVLSGFRGVVYTDVFQCVGMYLAFACLFALAVCKWGGLGFLQTNLTQVPGFEHHLSLTGGMPLAYIVVWGGMACWIFVDPNFYQRCFAAKTPEIARRGILISIVFWAVFDLLCCGSALYAFAAQNAGKISFADVKMAHLALANAVLPTPLKGLFAAGVLAAIMSTADSFLFAGAMNISRDYYWRFFNRQASPEQMIFITRIAIVVTAVLAASLAIWLPSIKDLWYTLGTVGLSALLVPAMCSFIPRFCCSRAALVAMICGSTVAFSWLLMGKFGGKHYPFGLEPLYPGLALAILSYALVFAAIGVSDKRR